MIFFATNGSHKPAKTIIKDGNSTVLGMYEIKVGYPA